MRAISCSPHNPSELVDVTKLITNCDIINLTGLHMIQTVKCMRLLWFKLDVFRSLCFGCLKSDTAHF